MGVKSDLAGRLFSEGCNCAQAVFCAFADEFGMDKDTAMKVSAGLGGGVGRLREVCGTVTGAALVLGMRHGNTDGNDTAARAATYEAVQAAAAKFKERNGSIVCRELLSGVPKMSTGGAPEERTQEYYQKRPCRELVMMMAEILEQE